MDELDYIVSYVVLLHYVSIGTVRIVTCIHLHSNYTCCYFLTVSVHYDNCLSDTVEYIAINYIILPSYILI